MKNKIHKIGDVLFLDMLKSEKTKAPIAKTEEGVICLLNLKNIKVWPKIGSTWMLEVERVDEKKLILVPIEETATKEDNEHQLKIKLLSLKKEKVKKVKAKYNYQYERKN